MFGVNVELIKKMYAWEEFIRTEEFIPAMTDVAFFYEEEGRYQVQDYMWKGKLHDGFYSQVVQEGNSIKIQVGNKTSYASFYNEGEPGPSPPLTANVREWIEDKATNKDDEGKYVNKMHNAMVGRGKKQNYTVQKLGGYVDRMLEAGDAENIMEVAFQNWVSRNNFA